MSRRRKDKGASMSGPLGLNMESIIKTVAAAQVATQHIPVIVAQELRKAWKQIPNTDPQRSPKSWMHDPLSLQYALGYKDRRFSLTYETLKRIATQLGIINAIINTRAAQVASFAQPYRWTRSLGFAIRHKDPDHRMTPAEVEFIKELEDFVLRCGRAERNPYARVDRDDFENFLRKIVRDSLVLDQCHPASTQIECADGVPQSIETIEVGTEVRTHTGRIRRVVERMRRLYTGDLITIRSGGQSVGATSEHPFLAVTDRWFRLTSSRGKGIKPDWTPASELTDEHYLVYPKPKLTIRTEPIQFQIFDKTKARQYPNIPYREIADATGINVVTVRAILCGYYRRGGPAIQLVKDEAEKRGFSRSPLPRPNTVTLDEKFATFCGFYTANGHTGKNSRKEPNAVGLTFHKDDEHLLIHAVQVFDSLGIGTTDVGYDDCAATGVTGNSVELARFMAENFGDGAHNKRVPSWMFEASDEVRAAFLRGYLACDGSVANSSMTFSTVSRALFGGLRVLLAAAGMYTRCSVVPAQVIVHEAYSRNHSEKYVGRISGTGLQTLSDGRLLNIPVPTQQRSAFIQDDEFLYIKIEQVTRERVENYPVFNLEIDEDHSYIAEGFASHNCCFEVVPDGMGLPYEFWAVDAATIRIAADDRYVGVNTSYHDRMGFKPTVPGRFANLYEGREYGQPLSGNRPIAYVQVINGQIENVYSSSELSFGVRNPRTDIYIQGYGFGELEQLITIVTAHLYAEEYNRKFFSQGTAPKGILNLKGDNYTPEQLEGFRRQWLAQVSGVENSWKTPILQSEGLEWVDLAKTNQEMEFGKWIEYLIKITCGVYLIDPAEINFEIHGGQQQTPLFEASQEWKLKASRDRGLKPILRFIAKLINKHVIDKIDDHFTFEFVGLDELSENEKHEMLVEQISSYMSLNEGRQTVSLPPLPGGDVPLNPVYISALQAQGLAQGGAGAGGKPGGSPGGEGKPAGPKYSDNFGQDNEAAASGPGMKQ